MTDTAAVSPPVPTAAVAAPVGPPWARRVTRWIDPANVIVVCLVLVGGVRHGLAGVGWALFATCFAGVLPMLFIRLGMRSGRFGDRYVGDRAKRTQVIPVVMASVLVGLALMAALGAPRELTAMIVAMLATLVPILVITSLAKWKVSIHTAVSGGAVAMLAVALGFWWLLGGAVVVLVACARVAVRDHTAAQTAVGALVGAVTAGLVFALVR
jgi:membrane-associated phospholipid phosphatase